MKNLTIEYINENVKNNPKDFIFECEESYSAQVANVANIVKKGINECPIVLISGPSSSGKTTTSKRIKEHLESINIACHTISMDDYYVTRKAEEMPRDEEGNIDLESPLCMDLPLLSQHLIDLTKGKEIDVPQYDFISKSRTDITKKVHLEDGEAVVIEGLHALSDVITGELGEKGIGVYISVASQVYINNDNILDKNMLRFARRAIRDSNFRAASVEKTLSMWKSVMRGEEIYIKPFKNNAKIKINSYMPYESAILMNMLCKKIKPYKKCTYDLGLNNLYNSVDMFENIDYKKYMPENSLLHEFIG